MEARVLGRAGGSFAANGTNWPPPVTGEQLGRSGAQRSTSPDDNANYDRAASASKDSYSVDAAASPLTKLITAHLHFISRMN